MKRPWLSFDRMEYPDESDDAEEVQTLSSALFRGTKNVKVLVNGGVHWAFCRCMDRLRIPLHWVL